MNLLSIYPRLLFQPLNLFKRTISIKSAIVFTTINVLLTSTIISLLIYKGDIFFFPVISSIIIALILLFYTAILTHLILIPFSNQNFKKTMTAYAYAFAPLILNIFPFAIFISSLLSLAILSIALSFQHKIPIWTSILSLSALFVIHYLLTIIIISLTIGM